MNLKEGHVLHSRYKVQRVMGKVGPIDTTYQAHDTFTDQSVVIREYFPTDLVFRHQDGHTCAVTTHDSFAYGLAEYELEGNALARVNHPNVAHCRAQFKENGTIYRVSDRLVGLSLEAYLRRKGGRISEEKAIELAMPFLKGLDAGHRTKLTHGSLSLRSIFLSEGKTPMLFNFQAARIFHAQITGKVKEVRVLGFSPPEVRGERASIGTWSDVYSAGAILYSMTTGRRLPAVIYPAHHEKLKLAVETSNELSAEFKAVLLQALHLEHEKRPQSMGDFLKILIDLTTGGSLLEMSIEELLVGQTGIHSEDLQDFTKDIRRTESTPSDPLPEITEGIHQFPMDLQEYQPEYQQTLGGSRPVQDEPVSPKSDPLEGNLKERIYELEEKQQKYNGIMAAVTMLILIVAAGLAWERGLLEGLGTAAAENAPAITETLPVPQQEDIQPAVSAIAVGAAVTQLAEVSESAKAEEDPAPIEKSPAKTFPQAIVSEPVVQPQVVNNSPLASKNEQQYQYLRGRGDVLLDQKLWNKALIDYTSALRYKPGDKYLTEKIALAKDAIADMAAQSTFAKEQERKYQYLLGQGDVLYDQQLWDKALDVYTSALVFRTDDAHVLSRIDVINDSIQAIAKAKDNKEQLDDLVDRITDEDGIFVVSDTPPILRNEVTLRKRVKYPSRARKAGIEGRVIVKMVVDDQGRVQDLSLVEGIGFGCDEEVTRVLKEALFEPATFKNAPVKAWYMFSVVFSL